MANYEIGKISLISIKIEFRRYEMQAYDSTSSDGVLLKTFKKEMYTTRRKIRKNRTFFQAHLCITLLVLHVFG